MSNASIVPDDMIFYLYFTNFWIDNQRVIDLKTENVAGIRNTWEAFDQTIVPIENKWRSQLLVLIYLLLRFYLEDSLKCRLSERA